MQLKYIIDLDGTIYHQSRVLPFAEKFISYLQSERREFLFFTNSPERSPQELSDKLKSFNINVAPEKILTAACIAEDYLLAKSKHCKVFVIGTEQFKESLRNSGFKVISDNSENADYVICGFSQQTDFSDIKAACKHIWNGAELVCTNFDESIPDENGFTPHTGAINASIEYATGKKAVMLGKPGSYTFNFIRKKLKAESNELCIVGDRIDTDMKFGKINGAKAFLVYTGITDEKEGEKYKDKGYFDIGFKNLDELIKFDISLRQNKENAVFSF